MHTYVTTIKKQKQLEIRRKKTWTRPIQIKIRFSFVPKKTAYIIRPQHKKGYNHGNGGDNAVFTPCVNSSPPGWMSTEGGRGERGEAGRRWMGGG